MSLQSSVTCLSHAVFIQNIVVPAVHLAYVLKISHFQVGHFPAVHFRPSFSSPAFSGHPYHPLRWTNRRTQHWSFAIRLNEVDVDILPIHLLYSIVSELCTPMSRCTRKLSGTRSIIVWIHY